MPSKGVAAPKSRFVTMKTWMDSYPNCGIDRVRVTRKMPSDVAANKWGAVPARNNGTEPAISTARTQRTTVNSDSVVAA
jgi:hypothetical protein